MTFILSFLEHAFLEGAYEGDILGVRARVDGCGQASVVSDVVSKTRGGPVVPIGSPARRLTPKRSDDDTVRVIRREELQALIRWAGPRPTERVLGDRTGLDRDFVLLALGWAVGLRAAEMLGLRTYPFESIVVDPQYPGHNHQISVLGKGNKTRRVDVPGWLVQDVQAYIAGERRRTLVRRGRRTSEAQLLLNSEAAKSHVGKPISKSGLDTIMNRACNACGLTEKSERTNPETGEIALVARPKHSLHCLRHTYAVMTYHNMAAAGFSDYERWKHIQLQLGHSSPKTTMDYYLRHVSVWSSKRAASALMDILR